MQNIEVKIGLEVSINGVIYPVMLDEIEILEAAEKIKAEAESIQATPESIRAFGVKVSEFLDKVLGAGSTAKIAGGRKISVTNLLALMTAITSDITRSYADTLKEYKPRE